MKIDYMQNPLAIVRRYKIPYGDDLYLEGIITARTEECVDESNWFEGEVRYPETCRRKFGCEIGGVKHDKLYQKLKRGADSFGKVLTMIIEWCDSFGLEITKQTHETTGILLD